MTRDTTMAERRNRILDECSRELATTFERPATDILSYHAGRLDTTVKELRTLLRKRIAAEQAARSAKPGG